MHPTCHDVTITKLIHCKWLVHTPHVVSHTLHVVIVIHCMWSDDADSVVQTGYTTPMHSEV